MFNRICFSIGFFDLINNIVVFEENLKVKYFKEFFFLLNYINGYDMFKCLFKNLYLV